MKVFDCSFYASHRKRLEVWFANSLRDSSEDARVCLNPCNKLIWVLDGDSSDDLSDGTFTFRDELFEITEDLLEIGGASYEQVIFP